MHVAVVQLRILSVSYDPSLKDVFLQNHDLPKVLEAVGLQMTHEHGDVVALIHEKFSIDTVAMHAPVQRWAGPLYDNALDELKTIKIWGTRLDKLL